jgi:NADH dehydrogenase
MSPPRIVIVGAGFGGLWCARGLARAPAEVVLVDRNNYHTFFPLLYQVAAAELVPTDIAYPVRSIFRGVPNVQVRMTEVRGLDVVNRRVETTAGPVGYDVLVLAMGSVPHFFGVEGAAEHAFPLRWMEDAIPLRRHILTRFEAAATTDDPIARRRQLTFGIVGGGPTGVEFAGALVELVYGPLLRDYPSIHPDEVAVVLLEAADRLLGGMPKRLGDYAAERLRRRRVKVRLGVRVDSLGPGSVLLNGRETMSTDTVVWTAGVQGDPAVHRWGLPTDRGGRIPVDQHLRVVGHEEIYAVGDLAYLEGEDGAPLPQVAQVAIQQGRCAAHNILAAYSNEPMKRFRYRDLGILAVIGRNAAVAHVFGLGFRGLLAWVLWLVIHVTWLIGFRNRALVLVNWAWDYVFFRRAVRLILPLDLASDLQGEDPPAP